MTKKTDLEQKLEKEIDHYSTIAIENISKTAKNCGWTCSQKKWWKHSYEYIAEIATEIEKNKHS